MVGEHNTDGEGPMTIEEEIRPLTAIVVFLSLAIFTFFTSPYFSTACSFIVAIIARLRLDVLMEVEEYWP